MTPNLDIEVDLRTDEPFEWILKALAAICFSSAERNQDVRHSDRREEDEVVELARVFTKHPIPLVKYAAHKTLYCLTGETRHAMELVRALGYGVEHHYSQRVLIRDLGDVGFAEGAQAVAECPMVENSFKILALKNMLSIHKYNVADAKVRTVLRFMDSLL